MKIAGDAETKTVAGTVFAEFLRISHPFIPFITDYLAKELKIADTLILQGEPAVDESFLSKAAEEEVDSFVELIHEIRSTKQSHGSESAEYRRLLELQNDLPEELKPLSKLAV
jgi:valyl-tRNA synthetase